MRLLILTTLVMFASCRTKNTPVTEASNSQYQQAAFKAAPTKSYNGEILPYLKTLKEKLESDLVVYNWLEASSCNVGLMAQLVTGMSQGEVFKAIDEYTEYNEFVKENKKNDKEIQDDGSWRNRVGYYCGITGKPTKGLIGELQKAGFTSEDIIGLEYLSDKTILAKSGIEYKSGYYTEKEYLIQYLKAWIEIMETQPTNQMQMASNNVTR